MRGTKAKLIRKVYYNNPAQTESQRGYRFLKSMYKKLHWKLRTTICSLWQDNFS